MDHNDDAEVPPSAQRYVRLGQLVEERRRALGWKQDQLPKGPSSTTVSQIENGEPVGDLAYKRLQESLRWSAASVKSVLKGGSPSITPIDVVPADLRSSHRTIESLRMRADWARQHMIQAKYEGQPEEQERFKREYDMLMSEILSVERDIDARRRESEMQFVQLSLLADDADDMAALPIPHQGADHGITAVFIGEVQALIRATERLTDAVHAVVLDSFDGDLAQLRKAKRDLRRQELAADSPDNGQVRPTASGDLDAAFGDDLPKLDGDGPDKDGKQIR